MVDLIYCIIITLSTFLWLYWMYGYQRLFKRLNEILELSEQVLLDKMILNEEYNTLKSNYEKLDKEYKEKMEIFFSKTTELQVEINYLRKQLEVKNNEIHTK